MISTKVFLSKVHGFYMALVTRSSLKSKNTLVSQKIQDYFSKLIEPLATNAGLT